MELDNIFDKVKNHKPTILGSENFSKFAILLPLIQMNDEIHVLFEVRSKKLRSQPGEICFPGGRIDVKDKTEMDAALRETNEELGISQAEVKHVTPLDYLVSPFGMIIYPFAGFIQSPESITPNPDEVGEIFTVPLSFFTKNMPRIYRINLEVQPEENFPFELIIGGQNYNWRTRKIDEYFYLYEDKVIWGLTAKILSHFVDLIK